MNQRQPDTRAVLWMTTSVFLWSWSPLVVALVGSTTGPFLFHFWHSVPAAVIWLGYVAMTCPNLIRHKKQRTAVLRLLPTREGILATLCGTNLVLFVGATHFLDTALVTVLTSGWLLVFVAYQKYHDNRQRYRNIAAQDWALITTALTGIAFVTLSQSDHITSPNSGLNLLWGLLLAAASAITQSWLAYRFKLGSALHHKTLTEQNQPTTTENKRTELAHVLAVSVATSIPTTAISLLIGLTIFPNQTAPNSYTNHPIPVSTIILIIIAGIASSSGGIAFRYANLKTKNLGVNTITYLRPLLTLTWLSAFATVTVDRTDLLWIGAAAVIATNALINFRSEKQTNPK